MNKCVMKRLYNEPNENYVCFSTSLFYKENYIKVTKNMKTYNVSMEKVKLFLNNIKNTLVIIQKINKRKVLPMTCYYRIYYDKTLYKLKEYKYFLDILKKIKIVQLIEYNCEEFKNINNKSGISHIELFGTFMRFFSIFDNESPNMKYVLSVDADSYYKEPFFEILKRFINSKNIVSCIMNLSIFGFYVNDFDKMSFFNYSYMMGGAILIKKDKIFTYEIWEQYFYNMFEQYDLMYILNYLDFKRLAFNSMIETDVITQSYYSFNYGYDEIWINYVIKKILIDNKKTELLQPYITKDVNYKGILKRLTTFLKYNQKINKKEFDLFMKEFDYKSIDDYEKDIMNKKFNYLKFFNKLKKNKYLNRIYIQNSIKYIILNIHTLLKKRGRYYMRDIMDT